LFPEELIEKIYTSVTINDDTCWIWNGSVNNAGYGTITFNSRSYAVHRVMFEHYDGKKIPHGYQVHHAVCENKRCIRYDHLRLVTPSMNNLLKSAFVSKRKERLLKLNDYQHILTTTELANTLDIKRTNVVQYLRSVSAVYNGFHFSVVKKWKGPKPSTVGLIFEPGFFERLEEPEENWKDKPAFCAVSFASFSAVAA
jgi:hypothetical protein